jgi:hypothetical protein
MTVWGRAIRPGVASHFRSTPNNGHCQTAPACLKGAMSDQSINGAELKRLTQRRYRACGSLK